MTVYFSHYIRCGCDLEGKLNGARCQYCDGWGILLSEMPPTPIPGQQPLPFTSTTVTTGDQP
jgi:hypothetical protein